MGKVLKVCLAMGGGVSLGTFSGAALTESLKLLLLFGKDKEGNPYEDVVVDGMSGASAGAIALTIMLRTLIDYKSMMKVYNQNSEANKEITEALLIKELAEDYFFNDKDSVENHENFEKLKAIQVAQKIQKQIWTEKITSRLLLEKKINGEYKNDPHGSFSILDRGILIDLAKKYLVDPLDFDLNNMRLLDPKRVVFACSLTNLIPIEIKAKDDKVLNQLEANVLKSTGSHNHSELRVFDFIFDKTIQYSDDCWFKVRKFPKDGAQELDLNSKKAWSIFSSSALACGAFPFAFEPVVLKRYKNEFGPYGDGWPKALSDIKDEIDSEKIKFKNSFFRNSELESIDYESYNFPYIDGGTFNNEPIKEAFKISSFQDYGKKMNQERLVLFVDPAVRTDKFKSFKVPSYQSIVQKPNNSVKFNKEINKLIANVSATVGLLANQGSIKEEHKIKDVKESLGLRDNLFLFIDQNDYMYKKLSVGLIHTAFVKINKNLNSGIISLGTRNYVEYFHNEISKSDKQNLDENLEIGLDVLIEINDKILKYCEGATCKNLKEENDDFLYKEVYPVLNKGFDEVHWEKRNNLFAQTIFKIVTDFSLRTVGKNSQAEFMAILPISPEEEFLTIQLPGDEVQAFAGFASKPSRIYSFEYGRLSTLISLSTFNNGFRTEDQGFKSAIVSDEELKGTRVKLLKEVIDGLEFFDVDYKYCEEIKEELYDLGIERLLKLLFPNNGSNRIKRFLALKLPTQITGLLALIMFPFKSFKMSTRSVRKLLDNFSIETADGINYKTLVPITISILSNERLKGKIKIGHLHPSMKSVSILPGEHDCKNTKRYQYLFQLYQLEYVKSRSKSSKRAGDLSTSTHKMPSQNIERVGLTVNRRLKNPSIDPYVHFEKWRTEIEEESEKIEISELSFNGNSIGDLITAINNKEAHLFYSLKNINYYVNPTLEYDIDSERDWYFVENTRPFYLDLLKGN
ncbi:hypothetical protein [Formosa sp. S-31]|uniref:hypothetical protein n=1 Tax=Formosa sp. S-31 TaxID=2790949 RepID=UPI003EBE7432